jgi:hypothetical protein
MAIDMSNQEKTAMKNKKITVHGAGCREHGKEVERKMKPTMGLLGS